MPTTTEQLLYLIMSALIVVGVSVIGWLVNRGFNVLVAKVGSVDEKLGYLSNELRQEREDRITNYGAMKAEFAAHKAVCEYRHREE